MKWHIPTLLTLTALLACGDTATTLPGTSTGTDAGASDSGAWNPFGGGRADGGPATDVASLCGTCPAERPICHIASCLCTGSSCGAGAVCESGQCVPCDTDDRCGPSCTSCAPIGGFCSAGGCVQCDDAHPCDNGNACAGGSCEGCDTAERCGPACEPCGGEVPVCQDGKCACTEASCPVGTWCDGSCAPCTGDAHCGFECIDCTGTPTPVCKNGQCVCTADGQCGPGQWCSGGACVPCSPTDALHCGATCAVCGGAAPVCKDGLCACASSADCGPSYTCIGGGCQPCNTDARCGAACLPCSGAAPACNGLQCTCTDTSCAPGQWCDGTVCQSCGPSDPLHCGPLCGVCGDDTPVCQGGVCVCTEDAHCGTGAWCKGGVCAPCANTDPLHCGPSCALCPADAPVCLGGSCGCTEGSCPGGTACEAGTCKPCNSATKCGPTCEPCGGATPVCDGKSCVPCTADAQCGAGKACMGGACEPCGQSDPAHCGPSCAVCTGTTPACQGGACVCEGDSCGPGALCAGACVPCNTAATCGPSCGACAAPTPHCAASGSGCVECTADAHCAGGLSCQGGKCVLPCAPSCCSGDSSPNAKKCSTAIVVGRPAAAALATWSGDTTGDGNDDDVSSSLGSSCWDAKYDNFYRIYLMAGESMTATLTPKASAFDAMLKLYKGTGCKAGGDELIACTHSKGDGGVETFTWVATSTGWFTVVVDGRMAFEEDLDYGPYTFAIKLACIEAGCGCQ